MVSSVLLGTAVLAVLPGISCASATDIKSGCGKSLPEGVELGESVNLTINSSSGVSTREYRLHLPKSYNTNQEVPLILSFHGRGKDAKFQEELSQFSNATYGFDGVSVYPQGVPVSMLLTRTSFSTDIYVDVFRHPAMARGSRFSVLYQRRHIHAGAPRPSSRNLLH